MKIEKTIFSQNLFWQGKSRNILGLFKDLIMEDSS